MSRSEYLEKLGSLNVDRSSGHPKPHKVCLLLAIMDLIKTGQVHKNQFVINDSLKAAFTKQFALLKKGNDAENINLPFYHLQGDGFWYFKISEEKRADYEQLINNRGQTTFNTSEIVKKKGQEKNGLVPFFIVLPFKGY